MSEATLYVAAPARMLTANAANTMHWAQRARIVKLWREAAWALAKAEKLPEFATAEIDVYPHQRGGVLADTDAFAPVTKACLDGLRDANVLADDTGEYVLAIHHHPPERGAAGLTFKIKGELA